MSEVKVRLSMVVPGATLLSSQDCEKMSKKQAYNEETVTLTTTIKKGKKQKVKKEIYHIKTRKSKPATHNLSIYKEAYDYMTGKEAPSAKVLKSWSNMNKRARLEYHLNNIAEHFNALSFSYEILDD